MRLSVDLDKSVVLLVSSDYTLQQQFCFDSKNPNLPLFCVKDLENFFLQYFGISYEVKTNIFLMQGVIFVQEVGLKYLFSIVVGLHCADSILLK